MNEPKLTANDPVSPEVLSRLQQVVGARAQLLEQLMELEQTKVQILVGERQLILEKDRLIEKTLTDRGFDPKTPVEIDAQTGIISVIQPKA